MKKNSASQSAFFNPRVLIGLCIVLTGVFLALLSSGVFSAAAQGIIKGMTKGKIITSSSDPLVPVGFDCSTIHEKGIDKQENFRAGAIMIACGETPGVATSATSTMGSIGHFIKRLLMPLAFGAADVNLITGTETSPNITQSETFTWANPDNPNQILVAYNDSRGRNANPINISGASVSTDGGTTFTRLTGANGQSPFSGTEGDPVVFYNRPTSTWFTVWLDTGCGAQGLGGYKSATPSNPASWTHFCLHNNSQDDRESGWVDENSSSPFANRMYVSWNDFNVGGGAIFVSYSSDNGTTWHAPISVTSSFIRNVQITGDKLTGDLYIAGMDEMGGSLTNRANKIYRSTDGGNTWINTYTGPAFPAPGRANCTANSFFVCMYAPNTWRHQGWGEPAAYNHVVSLVYDSRNTSNGDPGDVYYIRSTDSGVTFSAPFKLNTDTTTRLQWQPNLSVSDTGSLLSVWYDERETTTCAVGVANVPCYRMWARKSNDNGATWLPDDMFSDVISPLPAQPDPGIQPNYQGDYDYGSAILTKHLSSWDDGRNAINGLSQQDAFTDRDLIGFSVTTTTPACNSVINTQPVDFVINVSDPVDPATVQVSDFTVNGIAANSFILGSGNTQMTFHFDSAPVTSQ
ncbi:MAG TPA: sialidase family protein, partial [Chthoniobacterales bacterium]